MVKYLVNSEVYTVMPSTIPLVPESSSQETTTLAGLLYILPEIICIFNCLDSSANQNMLYLLFYNLLFLSMYQQILKLILRSSTWKTFIAA